MLVSCYRKCIFNYGNACKLDGIIDCAYREAIPFTTKLNKEDTMENKFMDKYKEIANNMIETCIAKNNDYGSSVEDTYKKFGDMSYLVRITDKYNRILSLIDKEAEIKDESIDDTILDMANYCCLWLASRKLKK